MRKLVLLVASVPLLFAPSARAEDASDAEAICQPPEVNHHYDTEDLWVDGRLPASGCPSRENSMFMVSAQLTRTDDVGPAESVSHALRCGPFMSAEDRRRLDMAPGEYFCNLGLSLEHQPVDDSVYEIEITYPDAGTDTDETTRLTFFCTSDGTAAACDTKAK
jgi:hypothetical protein